MASRSENIHAIAIITRHVVLADWIFTAPTVVIQLITGLWLMHILNYSYTSPWFLAVIGLYIFIGACWIPVVLIQYQLRDLALEQLETCRIETRFRKLMRRWTILGVHAFTGIVIMFGLMVIKPLATG